MTLSPAVVAFIDREVSATYREEHQAQAAKTLRLFAEKVIQLQGQLIVREQIYLQIEAMVKVSGNQEKAARALGVSSVYLSDVRRGRRPLAGKLLAALGYRRVDMYEQIKIEGAPEPPRTEKALAQATKSGIRVFCKCCGMSKQPRGRSAPFGSGCNQECPGYWDDPKPGDLWPGETDAEFGYPCGDDATEPSAALTPTRDEP